MRRQQVKQIEHNPDLCNCLQNLRLWHKVVYIVTETMGLATEVADRCVQRNCFLRIVFQRKLFFSWPTSSGYVSCLTPGLGVSHGNTMVHAVNARVQTATEGGQGEPGQPQIILGYHLMASVLFMFMDGDVLGADCICSPMGSWHSRKYSARGCSGAPERVEYFTFS